MCQTDRKRREDVLTKNDIREGDPRRQGGLKTLPPQGGLNLRMWLPKEDSRRAGSCFQRLQLNATPSLPILVHICLYCDLSSNDALKDSFCVYTMHVCTFLHVNVHGRAYIHHSLFIEVRGQSPASVVSSPIWRTRSCTAQP